MPEAGESGSPTVRLPHSPRETLRLVQVLRAVAALMVVAHHATMLIAQRANITGHTWENGASGVDLFFVISGLVMSLSTSRLASADRLSGSPRVRWNWSAAGNFLKRRVERVVPLYWLATTAKVLFTLALPALELHGNGTLWHVIASYLFLPSKGPSGTLEPTLVVGWTLNLEMLFYVLIAVALLLRVATWWVVVPAFLSLLFLSLTHLTSTELLRAWADPALPEFLWGMLLGSLFLRGKTLPPLLAGTLAVAGFVALLTTPSMIISAWRSLVWGLPAMAIVAGALALERHWGARTPAFLLLLGDASYSIYLSHGFCLPLLARWPFGGSLLRPGMPVALGCLGILLGCAVGIACYRMLELPMLRLFRLRRGTTVHLAKKGGGHTPPPPTS